MNDIVAVPQTETRSNLFNPEDTMAVNQFFGALADHFNTVATNAANASRKVLATEEGMAKMQVEHDQAIGRLQGEIDRSRADWKVQIEALHDIVAKQELELHQLRKANEALQVELRETRDSLREANEKLHVEQDAHAYWEARHGDRRSELDHANEQLMKIVADHDVVLAERNKAQETVETWKREYAWVDEARGNAEKALDETRQALAESTKIVGDTQKDLAQTRLDRDSVREQNGILAEHLNRARSTVSSLEALNTQYRQKFESLSEVLNKPLISIAA